MTTVSQSTRLRKIDPDGQMCHMDKEFSQSKAGFLKMFVRFWPIIKYNHNVFQTHVLNCMSFKSHSHFSSQSVMTVSYRFGRQRIANRKWRHILNLRLRNFSPTSRRSKLIKLRRLTEISPLRSWSVKLLTLKWSFSHRDPWVKLSHFDHQLCSSDVQFDMDACLRI